MKSSQVLALVQWHSGYCADMDIMSPLVIHSFVIISVCSLIMFFCCSNSFDEFVCIIDPVAQFLEQEQYSGHLNDIHTMLDLYQALEMIIATDKPVSMKLNSSSLQSLIQRLSDEFYPPNGLTKQIREQVLAISCTVFSSYYCYSLFDLGPTATVAYF